MVATNMHTLCMLHAAQVSSLRRSVLTLKGPAPVAQRSIWASPVVEPYMTPGTHHWTAKNPAGMESSKTIALTGPSYGPSGQYTHSTHGQ